jgi:YidC/Oxa1 family membrane protein insertase
MEERRLLIAVALSLLVLTAYQFLFPTAPTARRPVAGPSAAPSAGGPTAARSPAAVPSPGLRSGTAAAGAPVAVAPVSDALERRVEAQSEDVAVAFSNRGARLVSWQLKRYRDGKGRPEEMVQNIPGGPRALTSRWVILTGSAPAGRFLPAVRGSRDARRRRRDRAAPDWAEGELEASKTLRFQSPGYLVRVAVEVKKAGRALPAKVIWGPGLGNPTPAEMEVQGYHAPQGVLSGPRGVERLVPEKIGPVHLVTDVRWAGVEHPLRRALGAVDLCRDGLSVEIDLPADGQRRCVGVAVSGLWGERAPVRGTEANRRPPHHDPPPSPVGNGSVRI